MGVGRQGLKISGNLILQLEQRQMSLGEGTALELRAWFRLFTKKLASTCTASPGREARPLTKRRFSSSLGFTPPQQSVLLFPCHGPDQRVDRSFGETASSRCWRL